MSEGCPANVSTLLLFKLTHNLNFIGLKHCLLFRYLYYFLVILFLRQSSSMSWAICMTIKIWCSYLL